MIRAVVNADDFGINESVNKAIVSCFEKRIITNTTLMVNMIDADEAVELAEQYGFVDRVGLHLNLTQGYPLTKKIRKNSLFCDKDGRFNAAFHLKTSSRLKISRNDSAVVYEEIEAQIRQYLEYGLPEKHLDSHHHVHTDLSIWNMTRPLLKKYNFRTVRLGRNLYSREKLFNTVYKKYLNGNIKSNGYDLSQYFGSFKDLKDNINIVKNGEIVEVMLHPMYSEDGVLMDTKIAMDKVSDFFNDRKIILEAISI